jgi:hypothetical protein
VRFYTLDECLQKVHHFMGIKLSFFLECIICLSIDFCIDSDSIKNTKKFLSKKNIFFI